MTTNARDTIRDSNTGKVCATIERIISDACNTIRDCNTGKAFAIIERMVSDFFYRKTVVYRRNHNICIGAGTNSAYAIGCFIRIECEFKTFAWL